MTRQVARFPQKSSFPAFISDIRIEVPRGTTLFHDFFQDLDRASEIAEARV
jgi:hypothetical protein